jgi:bifunctional non-homologous end joining protein LigD
MRGYQAMKAVLADKPVSGREWIFERKLDGIRCGVVRGDGTVRLVSRSGELLNRAYPELVEALTGEPDLIADGELVAFERGRTSFGRLQRRMQIRDPELARSSGVAVYLYLFDLLDLEGDDLRGMPLRERKRALRQRALFRGHVRYTPHRVGDGEALLQDACRRGWEGLIAKRADSAYVATRSTNWLKAQVQPRSGAGDRRLDGAQGQPPAPGRDPGRLLAGRRAALRGQGGTGFDAAELERLGDELERRERSSPPFAPDSLPRAARWAEPELVAQIAFTERTRDGRLRHPCYEGLRQDKPAREVVREEPT